MQNPIESCTERLWLSGTTLVDGAGSVCDHIRYDPTDERRICVLPSSENNERGPILRAIRFGYAGLGMG